MNRIALAAIVLALAFGWSDALAQANQQTDTQRLIEAFIQAGVIAPEKAAAARSAVAPGSTSSASASSTLEILYPLRGNVLTNGSGRGLIAEIRWRQAGSSLPVSISLLNSSGQELRRLATGTPATGSYKWQYDPTIPEGSYELLVAAESGAAIVWAKSGLFTLRSLTPSTCRDSDAGIQPNVAGAADDRIQGIGSYIEDRSVSSNGGPCSGATCTGVLEAYCENGKALSRVYQCSTGYSIGGACAQRPSQSSGAAQQASRTASSPSYVSPASYQYSPSYAYPTYTTSYPNTPTTVPTSGYAVPTAVTNTANPSAPTNTGSASSGISGGGGGGGIDSSRFIQPTDYWGLRDFPSSYPTYPTFPGGRGPSDPWGSDIWILLPGGAGLSGLDRALEIFSGWFKGI